MSQFPQLLINRLIVISLIFFVLIPLVWGKNQYVVPLNMGMKVSVQYDIANLWNNAIVRGAAVSAACAVALLAIIFFGVITSPFGYFFGVPSKKYVLGDIPFQSDAHANTEGFDGDISDRMDDVGEIVTFNRSQFFPRPPLPLLRLMPAPRSLPITDEEIWMNFIDDIFNGDDEDNKKLWTMTTANHNSSSYSQKEKGLLDIFWKYYVKLATQFDPRQYNRTLLDSMFHYLPKSGVVRTEGCELLTVCYAHGAFKRLPDWMIKIYHIFSGKISTIPKNFKKAILVGLDGEENCLKKYSDSCSEDPFTLVLKSYTSFLPKESKVPKRKQAMYM